MGSAVLKKASPSVVTFVYCFLLISFLFNKIPHQVLAKGEESGKSGVVGSPPRHSQSATTKGSPTQSSPKQASTDTSKPVVDCGRRTGYKSCLPKVAAHCYDKGTYNQNRGC